MLDGTLAARPAVYVIWIGLSLLTVPMFMFSPKELAPAEDQGVIFGIIETPSNSTLEQTSLSAAAANKIFMDVPETDYTFQLTFPTGGFGGMIVRPWSERERSVHEILPKVQQKMSMIPDIRLLPVVPQALPGGGSFPVEFIIASTADHGEILGFAQEIANRAMAKEGMFFFPPVVDTKIDLPQSELVIDRDKVAALGLNLQQVGADVGSMLGGNFVNRFSIDGRSYKVIPQVKREARLNPGQLGNIHVTGPDGKLVPLSTIASIKETTEPRSLNRFQQLNAVKISGATGKPLDEALRTLEDLAAEVLPDGYTVDYTGDSRQLRTEGNKFLPAFTLAVVLIFLVLAAQFNSFRDPIIILLGSVPLAIFGAMIFTFLKMPNPSVPWWTDGFTTTVNIYSQVGLITLVGLVSKNGILIVEWVNQLQSKGCSKLEAVHEASLVRLRAVLMTSVATVCGHFPLTLVTGPGASARNSIGIVIVAGMAIGTVFTLFVVPCLYMLFARDHSRDFAAASEPVSDAAADREPQPALHS